jgi:exosortase A-associated hydrolase 2
MQEDQRFLALNGERVFSTIHHPSGPWTRAIVMCHPLGEEKLWAHRVFVSFARDLAAAGFAVVRFDFRGEGDSDREFERTSLETRIEDAGLAVDAVRALNPSAEVIMVGLRLGATIALAAAIRRGDVARVVLWDPVVDGAAYMQTVLRLNLMYQMALHRKVVESREVLVARLGSGETVNIEGYELARPLFEEVSALQLAGLLTQYAGETLIVQINQEAAPLKPELAALAEGKPRCSIQAVQEQPFWKETRAFCHRADELTRVTVQWLGGSP